MPSNLLRKQRLSRRSRGLRRLFALSIASAVLGGACLTPTQITVQITTNAVCAESTEDADHLRDVAIIAGSPDSVLNGDHTPNTTTADCGPPKGVIPKGFGPQEVGTLVIVPSGDKDVPAKIVVVGRVAPLGEAEPGKSMDACILWAFTAQTGETKDLEFASCIVTRRNLAFFPHTKLELPMQLDTNCAGVVCDADSYCFDSHCVDANVTCGEDQPLCLGNVGQGGSGSTSSSMSTSVSMTSGSMTSGVSSGGGGMTTGSLSSTGSSMSSVGGGGSGPATVSVGSSSGSGGGSGPATVSVGSSSSGSGGGSGPATVSVSSSSGSGGGSGPATVSVSSSSSSGGGGSGPVTCTMICGPGCACVMKNVCECP